MIGPVIFLRTVVNHMRGMMNDITLPTADAAAVIGQSTAVVVRLARVVAAVARIVVTWATIVNVGTIDGPRVVRVAGIVVVPTTSR